ncbi:hypothetical protein FBR02_04845 [Anaerolineae bacterium CFX9]|nr:hypothetical protein [Anaerolineae bacterium CFX9]
MTGKRSPIRRYRASHYLLVMLVSFAIAVVGTRAFLELTGYPQIGNSTLHIAHVLWGGLALFASTLIMMIYANRWAFTVGAILSGIGVGLFIDEIGKFITQDNDYFFPLAAPLIYAFFVLTVFVYLRTRRMQLPTARQDLHEALDLMHEVLENDLDSDERDRLISSLRRAQVTAEDHTLRVFAQDLLHMAQVSESLRGRLYQPTLRDRIESRLLAFENRFVGRRVFRLILIAIFVVLAITTATDVALTSLLLFDQPAVNALEEFYYEHLAMADAPSFVWIAVHTVMAAFLFAAYVTVVLSLVLRRDDFGTRIGVIALIAALTLVNLLSFYINQFAAVGAALISLAILIMVLRYRDRFLSAPPPAPPIEANNAAVSA